VLVIIAALQIFLAIGFIAVWIYLFKYELSNPKRSEVYRAFERSFPLPDLCWITPTLIISAIGLLMDERFGIFFTIISGSSLIFLGLLDISFNLQQGGYKTSKMDTIFNLTINIICVIFGPIFLIVGWINF
jgi:heme/copper-type cytochrome/quinol oxidase subunit 2